MQSRYNCSRLRQLLPVTSPLPTCESIRRSLVVLGLYRRPGELNSVADFVPTRMPRAAATGKRDCQSYSDKTSQAVNFDFLLLLQDMLWNGTPLNAFRARFRDPPISRSTTR
ncbi:hypothetical protein N7450_011673 [Penicillium hetheringtonii]|uniref:Uncharacterized protein n=1 Tax=Penicillium hetheringtonii TaxID=911720 RepID=A0AAD6DAD7_9EURO|nr:hypothetical protein N7450_011673 [Penicillium hetheringtonii]